jgi:hypothetical protein
MEGQTMSHFVRGMIVTSAIGLALLGLSPSTTQAAPYRGHGGYYRHGYWGGGYRPYVGVGVYGGGYGYGYPGYYGYGYPGYAYASPAYYGGYYPGYYGGYYGSPGVAVGLGYGGGYWGGRGYYGGGHYGHWRR